MKFRSSYFKITGVILCGLLMCLQGKSQGSTSISGPTCVQAGVYYNYSISAYYSGTANFQYVISGGTLSTGGGSGTHTGPGVANVSIAWNTGTTSGSISLYSNAGSKSYSVTVTTFAGGSFVSGQSQTINYNTTPANLNCAAATGGSCTTPSYSYQWQMSTDNVNFSNVSGATSQTYTPGPLTQTTYYRRFVTETTTGNTTNSSVATIVVYPALNPGTITPASQTIAYNSNASTLTLSGVGGGNSSYSYQWQSSTDNINWTNVGTGVTTYTPGSVANTTYYHVIVTSNGVPANSVPATVNVSLTAALSLASTTPSGNGSINTLTCVAHGGSGIYTYAWYASTDGGATYQLIGGASGSTYTTGVVVVSTQYYVAVSSGGSNTNSNPVIITMPGMPSISANTYSICNGATATLTATGGSGNYTWYNSSNTQVGTGTTYSTTVAGSYYAVSSNTYGVSVNSNTVTITTISAPALTPIIGNTYCVAGSSAQLADAIGGGNWSSNNTSILTTDANGVITGITTGTATITYTVTNACGTSSQQLGITVVPFSTYAAGLGRGISDPVITDTITLVNGTVKATPYQQDTAYSSAHSITNVIALRVVEETSLYIPGDFSANVLVKIEYGHTPSVIYRVDSTNLSVTYTKNGGNKYNAIQYLTFNNAEYTRVTVLRVSAPTTVGGVSFDARQVLLLTNSLMATRYYQLADHKGPLLSYVAPGAGPVPDELPVSWVYPAHTGNNNTQLEWAWLPNGMSAGYMNGGVFDTTLLFKRNSTRLDLPGSATAGAYNIPLLYGDTGVLFIRARAINIMPNGSRSEDSWSPVLPFPFNGHNPNLNWQTTTSFTEEGKRKTLIQYFDGSLRARQTVTKDNSTQTTVSAETLYDGQGRAAVQILPAPGMSNIIAYTKNLNKFNTQPDNSNPLDYFDFTTASLGNYAATSLNTISGAGLYYSSQNPELNNNSYTKNIPSTNGYAYAVTRYTPDGTGRIMLQGSVGDSMQPGGVHVMKYYYGTAAQEELDALFGTEAGDYTHYFKNMVQDANGQMSVSYVDMNGKTIATALAGQSPTSLQALTVTDTSQYKNQSGSVMTRNLLDKGSNVLKGNSIESINSILVPFPTLYSFTYKLPRQILTLPTCSGGNVSYPCKFDLQIAVTDESGDTPPYVYTYPGIDTINFQQGLVLPVGSFSVRKTLTINQDSLTAFMARYDSIGVGLCRTVQNLTDSIASLDSLSSGCGAPVQPLSCSSCQAAIGTYSAYLQNYAVSIGYTSSSQLTALQISDVRNQYISDSSFCASLNTNVSHSLDNIRRMMLSDMVPYSGQYAQDGASAGSIYNKYNIFSPSGSTLYTTQPFYRNPRNLATTPDNYYDAFGRVDTTVTTVKLATLPAGDFETSFKSSWANALLAYHPEYGKLLYAQNNLQPAYNYIDSLNQLTGVTGSPVTSDPFFTTVSTGDRGTMVRYSDTSWLGGYSMWKIAYGDAFGCKTLADTTARKNCYAGMPSQWASTGTLVNPGTGNVALTATMQAQAWSLYKAFYTQAREDMVNRYINLHTDTLDNTNLVTQGYQIYFPYSNAQQAQNAGWSSWYPAQNGTYPPVSVKDSAKVYSSHCSGYITAWQNALLQCPALAGRDSVSLASILNSITGKLLLVCQQGTDGANPYGSSTVSPAYAGATYTSFEQAVNYVMDSLGIPRDQYCNPYGITYPKPYGYNATLAARQVAAVDTCTCSQFTRLKNEVATAGYSTSSLTTINQYLWQTYHDTITTVLYQGLLQCGTVYLSNCRPDSTIDPTCGGSLGSSGTTTTSTSQFYATISPSAVNISTGGSASFTCTVTGGCSPFTYQWQISTDGLNFTNITGATGTTYTSTYSSNRWLRVFVTGCSSSVYSNVASVLVGTCYIRYTHCDTLSAIPLLSPQPLPAFLACGFSATSRSCYACSQFQGLASSFNTIFGRLPVFTGNITNDTTIAYNSLFARYVNFKTGLEYGWQYYADQFNATGCAVGGITGTGAGLSICLSTVPLTDTTGLLPPVAPCQQVRDRAGEKAAAVYDQLQQQVMANFQAAYMAQCLATRETFTVMDTLKEYHYTLYYYDQAGNLEKTVPPKGVYPIYRSSWKDSVEADKLLGISLTPPHSMVTRYCYNSLNKVNIQKTPDGGVSRFYYDRLGRLTLSQNANQAAGSNVYSYTSYDSLGRITQVGQLAGGSAMTDAVAKNDANLQAWFTAAATSRNQVTQTVYDTAYPAINGVVLSQQNLRNRVSFTQMINNATDPYPANATYYTYDVHGNVDTLLQDFGNSSGVANVMNTTGNRFKRVQYEYDLVSGKVDREVYQPTYFDVTLQSWLTPPDQYYHLYAYDAENRVTDVYTGRDSVMLYLFREREAHYTYYKHGPLARTDLGQLRVQGLDHAYTLQGWLKGVNPVRGGTLANGTDTTEASPVAQDVYGFSLHYYPGDYRAIGYTPQGTSVLGSLSGSAAPLYDGNIAAMGVNIPQLGTTKLYNYHYDQLNRLAQMDTYNGLNGSAGTFTPVSISDYHEQVAYDPNGNIRTYQRNGDASRLSMDNMGYYYTPNTNRLQKVTDAAPDASAGTYSQYNDLKQGQADNNYKYDAIGNLVSDSGAGITNITWTAYGKIKSITQSGSLINYAYDVNGNRILKATSGDTTVYVRDATGTVLSIYEKKPGSGLAQTQVPVYGSSRLGIVTQHMAPDSSLSLTGGFGVGKKSIFTRGEKFFELSNHLGNVLVTITDRRQQRSAGGVSVDSYVADIASASDYYPFGMLMPARNYNAANYRYGVNGKENDNDVEGTGNQVDYGMRVYDPRVGRFSSVDPLQKKYPELTPYQFASNRPIDGIDQDGLEFTKFWNRTQVETRAKHLMQNPIEINQAAAGTCTVAAVTYLLILKNKDRFYDAVMGLYDNGEAYLYDWIKPNKTLQNTNPATTPNLSHTNYQREGADWIFISSVQDSENWFYDFNGTNKEGNAEGNTRRDLKDMMSKIAMYNDIKQEYFSSSNDINPEKVLNDLQKRYESNCGIVLEIDAKLIPAYGAGKPNEFEGHNVCYIGGLQITHTVNGPTKFTFDVQSWGAKQTITCDEDTFKKYYKGCTYASN